MKDFIYFEVFFSPHMTNLLFSRNFDRFQNCFLVEFFEEGFISFRNASHRNFRLKISFKIPTKKQIHHVMREEDSEITEIFLLRNPD